MASHELPGTHHTDIGEKGWHSGENTHLPPMWPRFFSQSLRLKWVEFVGSCSCFDNFLRVLRFSTHHKQQCLQMLINQETVDEEALCG